MIRKGIYGECLNCYRYNTSYSWCQSCDPQLLTEGWTSGNEIIDELIKSTQLKATRYDNCYYLQWIPYNKLENIEKMDESHFATLRKVKNRAAWVLLRSKEIADEFVEWSTKAANYRLAASLPIYLSARFAP